MINSTTYWHLSCIGVSNLSFLISLSPSPHQIPSSSFRPTRTKRGEIIGTHRASYWLVGLSTQRPGYWRCHHRRSNTCTFPLRKHGQRNGKWTECLENGQNQNSHFELDPTPGQKTKRSSIGIQILGFSFLDPDGKSHLRTFNLDLNTSAGNSL